MTMLSYVVFLLVSSNFVTCLYSDADDVVELTSDTFQSDVLESDGIWFVEFYAPWCGHCKNLAPEWKKAATYLKGYVNIGAVDATEHEDVGKPYDISGFPTIKVFSADKKKPTDYKGGRVAKGIVSAGFKEIKELIRSRMGLKKSSSKKKGSAVVKLTASNFEEEVMNSEDLWLVEFFAPWCGHCKNLAPHWKKAAKQLVGKVKLGEVDATVHGDLASKYDVKGYPTIKVFPKGPKSGAQDYQGGRTEDTIVKYALGLLGQQPSGGDAGSADDEDTLVVTLTSENFQEDVLDSDDNWMVEFYAPWCGHCKNLAPHWKKAAAKLENKVKLGAVDCTVEKPICEKYGVEGFPTIYSFPKSNKEDPPKYESGRTESAIVDFATEMYEESLGPIEVGQLINADSFKTACEDHAMCLIAFLPHILDTGADGRNKYIEILNSVAERHKKLPIDFLWSEAFAQQKLEETLRVGGAGYPAAVVVSTRKNVVIPFAGQFSAQSLKEFVTGVQIGAPRGTRKVDSIPTPVTVDAWDGKDGSPPVEDHEEL